MPISPAMRNRGCLGVLVAVAGSMGACRARAAPQAGGTFDVTHFGAKGDGVTYDTAAIRAATLAVAKAGGGTLLFPSGGTYLTGAFNITSNDTVVLIEQGATVLGSTRGEDWPLVIAAEVWPQFGHGELA